MEALVCQQPRWELQLGDGEIVAETINENIAALVFGEAVFTREELATKPAVVSAWDADAERLFLAGVDSDGRCSSMSSTRRVESRTPGALPTWPAAEFERGNKC